MSKTEIREEGDSPRFLRVHGSTSHPSSSLSSLWVPLTTQVRPEEMESLLRRDSWRTRETVGPYHKPKTFIGGGSVSS